MLTVIIKMIICERKSVDMRASLILLSCLFGLNLQKDPKCDGARPGCRDEPLLQRNKGQAQCTEGHLKTCADGSKQSDGKKEEHASKVCDVDLILDSVDN